MNEVDPGTHVDLSHLNGAPKAPALQRVSVRIERVIGTHIVFVKSLGDSQRVPVAVR